MYAYIGIGIGLLINIILVVYKYGKLSSIVEDNKKEVEMLKQKMPDMVAMEARLLNVEKLSTEVACISATLNQLVGKIDMFLAMWDKNKN